MNKRVYILVIIFAIALSLRFYPLLLTGLPFSSDGWSCIRNTELLIQNTPVSLGNNSLFDGYNNYLPANSLFGAVVSQVTGFAPIDAMAIGIPLAGALTIPLFYMITCRVTGNTKIASIATLLLATGYPYTLFTAGVTKETFATPLYLSVLLVFLLAPSWKRTLLFSVASATLVLAHHFTALITSALLICLTIALFYNKNEKFAFSAKSNVGLIVILSALTGVYLGFFAYGHLPFFLGSGDLPIVGACMLLVLAAALFFRLKPGVSKRRIMLVSLVTLVIGCFFAFFLTWGTLFPAAPTLPLHYVLYAAPFIVMLPLTMFSFSDLHKRQSSVLVPALWLAPLVGLEVYAVLGGSTMGLAFAARTLDFLVLPLFILVGIAFYKLYCYAEGHRLGKIIHIGVIAAILIVASLNTYSMFASVSLQEPYMGYFWLYRTPETAASHFTATYAANQTVAGDMKVFYLLNGYFNVKVNMPTGLRFLQGNTSAPGLMYVYPEMSTNGYVYLSGNVMALPQNWTNKLTDLKVVYSNGMVDLYAK